jgi:hypothetical protein
LKEGYLPSAKQMRSGVMIITKTCCSQRTLLLPEVVPAQADYQYDHNKRQEDFGSLRLVVK